MLVNEGEVCDTGDSTARYVVGNQKRNLRNDRMLNPANENCEVMVTVMEWEAIGNGIGGENYCLVNNLNTGTCNRRGGKVEIREG